MEQNGRIINYTKIGIWLKKKKSGAKVDFMILRFEI